MAWDGSNIRGVALPWLNRLKGVEWREQLEDLPQKEYAVVHHTCV